MKGAPPSEVTVHKLDENGLEVWTYSGRVIDRTATSLTLEAYFTRGDLPVSDLLIFRTGDRMVETFFADRWYNVFAVYDQDSARLKAWYCNIARPARIEAADVYQEDLALDVIVFPDGAVQVLDEDEFAALDLGPTERSQAMEALRTLREHALRGSPPFQG